MPNPQETYTNQEFSKVASIWLESVGESLAMTTKDRYNAMIDLYITPYIGSVKIRDISNVEIEELIGKVVSDAANKGRQGGALKESAYKRIREIVKRVVEFAQEKDFPNSKAEIPQSEKFGYHSLSLEEQEAIVGCAMKNRCVEMLGVLMMLFTGIRIGELCALSCDDISLERREIYIHQSVHRINLKEDPEGKKTRNIITEIPTKAHIRTENLPEGLSGYMEEFYREGTILLTGEKDLPMEARTMRNRIDRIFERCNIEPIPFQRYRKTWVEGKADASFLDGKRKKFGIPYEDVLDERWLRDEMRRDLKPLRLLLGLEPGEMGEYLGVSEATYRKMEEVIVKTGLELNVIEKIAKRMTRGRTDKELVLA